MKFTQILTPPAKKKKKKSYEEAVFSSLNLETSGSGVPAKLGNNTFVTVSFTQNPSFGCFDGKTGSETVKLHPKDGII